MLPEKIKIETARYYKVKTSDIESKKRSADITLPRMVAMYLIRENTDVSLADIGKLFGGRNHATVIHAIEKMEKSITEDSQLQTAVEAIEKKTREKSK
jgi:chromosomal replication initiator protein